MRSHQHVQAIHAAVAAAVHAAVAAALLTAAAPAAAVSADGDPVLFWNQTFLGSAPYNPGQQRAAAMLNIALHDAVNVSLGRPNVGFLGSVGSAGGDARAAAAVAAHAVLVELQPARAAEFNAALAASLALVPDGAAKTRGIANGTAVAAALFANRANDGQTTVVPYTPSGLPGRWAPTAPAFQPAVQPGLAVAAPWVMDSPSQFRAGPPPGIDSEAYATAYNEVKALGSATSGTRTADQTASAQFWASAQGPGPWIKAAIDRAELAGTSTLQNATTFARLATGVGDAVIAIWDTKYHHDYWRPVTGIRAGETDGNDGTAGDAAWLPLIFTPPHPSYGSAHAAVSGAAYTILADAFGDTGNFCLSSLGATRCWASFSEAALDSVNSRLWAGVHWRFDNEAGLAIGEAVGRWNLRADVFGAVPEPASWAMMILGFGVVGLACRRRPSARSADRRLAETPAGGLAA